MSRYRFSKADCSKGGKKSFQTLATRIKANPNKFFGDSPFEDETFSSHFSDYERVSFYMSCIGDRGYDKAILNLVELGYDKDAAIEMVKNIIRRKNQCQTDQGY